jgi:hypothetical protein
MGNEMGRGRKPADITGLKWNRLTALHYAFSRNSNAYWMFRCDCGEEKIVQVCPVKNGITKSCGCFNKEVRLTILRIAWAAHTQSAQLRKLERALDEERVTEASNAAKDLAAAWKRCA